MTKNTLDSFETALLSELRAYVAEHAVQDRGTPAPAPRRTRRRVAYAGLAAAAAAGAAVLVLPGTGAAPAYAVTADADGDVHVHVSQLEDPQGLEQALAEHGIAADVTYLPAGTQCAAGRYQPASASTESPMTVRTGPDGFTIDLGAGAVGAGETLVISATRAPAGSEEAQGPAGTTVGIAAGQVAPCVQEPMSVPPADDFEDAPDSGQGLTVHAS